MVKKGFLGALSVVVMAVFSLGFLVMGLGIISIGIPPSFDEFLRIVVFLLITCLYSLLVKCWNSIFNNIQTGFNFGSGWYICIWLFFTVFYSMIVKIIANAFAQVSTAVQTLNLSLSRISPNYLYEELTTILLTPSIRSLGALRFEQIYGAIPSTLSVSQSLLLTWPHITGLVAALIICFGIFYIIFMRQEIRA